jgi:glutathione S-transferase
METAPMVLFTDRFWVSPYVLSSYVALTEKGVPFEMREVDLKSGEHRQGAYASASVTARVPTLVQGDFSLSESSAIAEYLEESFPERARLFPADLRERARARQVMAFLRSDLGALRDERSAETVFYPRSNLPPLTPAGRAAAEKLIGVASRLLAPGASGLFAKWCLADTELAMMLQRLVHNGEDVPAPLTAFAERQWQRPSVRAWVEHPRAPFVPYFG